MFDIVVCMETTNGNCAGHMQQEAISGQSEDQPFEQP